MASHLKIIHTVLGFISQNVISMASYFNIINSWMASYFTNKNFACIHESLSRMNDFLSQYFLCLVPLLHIFHAWHYIWTTFVLGFMAQYTVIQTWLNVAICLIHISCFDITPTWRLVWTSVMCGFEFHHRAFIAHISTSSIHGFVCQYHPSWAPCSKSFAAWINLSTSSIHGSCLNNIHDWHHLSLHFTLGFIIQFYSLHPYLKSINIFPTWLHVSV